MNPNSPFARYRKAMDLVAAMGIDAAADSIVSGKAKDRTVDAAASILLHGSREIESTLKTLDLVEAMIGVAAPRSKLVPKHEYLKFLIGAYLQEVYILEQRLTTYATRIERAYRTRVGAAAMLKSIQQTLGNIIRLRGEHVHSHRYADKRIDLLQGVAFVENLVDGLHITGAREYKTVRTDWRRVVKKNNATTRALLQDYCGSLLAGISKDGRLILPRTGRGQHGLSLPLDA